MSVRYSLTRSSSSRSTRSLANDAPSSLESSEIRRAAHTPAGARPGLSSDPRYRLGQEAPPRDVVRCCVETRTRRGGGMGSSDGEVDLTMVLMRFDPSDPARLQSGRSEEHTTERQSLMRKSYAVFCLQKTRT